MLWIVIAIIAYLAFGGVHFLLITLTDEFTWKGGLWILPFVLMVFLWPLFYLGLAVALIHECIKKGGGEHERAGKG